MFFLNTSSPERKREGQKRAQRGRERKGRKEGKGKLCKKKGANKKLLLQLKERNA